jgi:hypothetical protein
LENIEIIPQVSSNVKQKTFSKNKQKKAFNKPQPKIKIKRPTSSNVDDFNFYPP